MQDKLIESIHIQIRSVVSGCKTSLKDRILSLLKEDKVIKECTITSDINTDIVDIYIPETL